MQISATGTLYKTAFVGAAMERTKNAGRLLVARHVMVSMLRLCLRLTSLSAQCVRPSKQEFLAVIAQSRKQKRH